MVPVDHMLISILSVSVDALEMLCAVAAEALVPRAWDMKPDLKSPAPEKLLPETPIPCFVLEMFISLVLQLLVVLHKVHNSPCPSQ